MTEDDEKTRLRRDRDVDERTRAVSREGDETQLRVRRGPSSPPPRASRPVDAGGDSGRTAHVPGAVVDHGSYGVRRDPLTVPVQRTTPAGPHTAHANAPADAAAGRGRRGRGSMLVILGVGGFAALLIVATILLVVWVTA